MGQAAVALDGAPEPVLSLAHGGARFAPGAALTGVIGLGPERFDVVEEVVFDAVARDRAGAAIPLLGPVRIRWDVRQSGSRPRRGVGDLKVGELVAHRAGVALELRLAALERVALGARFAQRAGRAGEALAVGAQRGQLTVGALDGRVQTGALGGVRVAAARQPQPRCRQGREPHGGMVALRADLQDLGLDGVELAQLAQRQPGALRGDVVERCPQVAQ